jgi:hypothetical protein
MTSSYDFLVWLRYTSRSDACIPEASPVGDSTAHVPNPWLTATYIKKSELIKEELSKNIKSNKTFSLTLDA